MKKWYLIGFQDKNKPDEIVYSERPKMLYEGGQINSLSPAYETKEELLEKNKVLKEPCKCCGAPVKTNYHGNKNMIERNLCFSCNFWEDKKESISKNNVFIINGEFYSDAGRKNSNNSFLGFGGREFKIQKDNNEIISTNNLWYGGEIPDRFKNVFQNNAKFIK